MKAVKFEKGNKQKPTNCNSKVYFLYASLFTETFSGTSTLLPGIFLGWALWADCVSLWMNTAAACD